MINNISVENFRVFKETTNFQLAPLTILAGPNNSGKSSILKLLDLLKMSFGTNKNFNKLRFDQGNHNLGRFDKVVNRSNSSDEIKLTFNFPMDYFNEDFRLELVYGSAKENGELRSFKIFNSHRTLLFLNGFYIEKEVDLFHFDGLLDIEFLKRVFNEQTICKQEEKYPQHVRKAFKSNVEKTEFKTELDILKYVGSIDGTMSYAESNDIYEKLKEAKDLLEIDVFAKKFYKTEYVELANGNASVPLFSLEDRNGGLSKEEDRDKWSLKLDENFILVEEKLYFEKFERVSLDRSPKEYFSTQNIIHEMFINEILKLSDFQIDFALNIGDELENVIHVEEAQAENFNKYFVRNIGNALRKLSFSFDTIDFVSASRGNKNRILSNKSSNDIDEIVKEFHEINIQDRDIEGHKTYELFLKQSLKLLEIEGSLEIERIEGVASVIYLYQKDKKVSLSDLGYGYSQIIPILLKIILLARNFITLDKRTSGLRVSPKLIIEEPEANLHPNLQSKLAEVLVLANKTLGIHFILETHSEYLIRKLQFLTAEEKIEEGEVSIYYYNDDKYVSEEEPKVKKIEINRSGGLTDTFGTGFFDEATKIQFELLKLNQDKNH